MLYDGHYRKDKLIPGYVYQEKLYEDIDIVNYNSDYLKPYLDYDQGISESLNKGRWSLLVRNLVFEPKSVLDVGYGLGGFLKVIDKRNKENPNSKIELSGYDPIQTPVDGVTILKNENDIFRKHYDVITMFDSLEHVPCNDIVDYISHFQCNYMMISVPWYQSYYVGNRFAKWKHRRPNEHLHFFSSEALVFILNISGYDIIHISNYEDKYRPYNNGGNVISPNILTVIAKSRRV